MLALLLATLATLASAGTHTLGPWTLSWDDARITLTDGRATPVSLVDTDGETSNEQWQVVSVVGPWFTTEHTWYAEGGAHPSYGQVWSTHDMTRGGRPVALTDLWPEDALLDALLADGVVKKARAGATGRPATVLALLESLDGGCEMDLGPRLLTSWAIHSAQGDRVAVRIGATHGCEVARGSFTQLGVWLPIPDGMAAAVARADAAGTLHEDLAPKR